MPLAFHRDGGDSLSMAHLHTIIAGGGIFGLTAALELRARGHAVTLFEPGPIPHPSAASTDISKVLRMEYGADREYMALMAEAFRGWHAWNARWIQEGKAPLYRRTGVLMLSRGRMAPGGFEFESHRSLLQLGQAAERLDPGAIARRFPAWNADRYVDGFYHREGGYAESGRVVVDLAERAVRAGVVQREAAVACVSVAGRRAIAVESELGTVAGDHVLIAAGAWTGKLVPELAGVLRPTGHPVFHLRPAQPALFRDDVFPVFTADVARTGYYGFPLHRDGVVKIANHGPGAVVDVDAPRVVPAAAEDRLRAFLAEALPSLVDAEIVYRRLCLYCDTEDEDFWIDRHPDVDNLTVASGGSGHGFKFAPLLGGLAADAVEGKGNRWREKFRWRPEVRLAKGLEAARWHG